MCYLLDIFYFFCSLFTFEAQDVSSKIQKCSVSVTKLSYDSELLGKLLARPGLKTVNAKDKNGWTPLMFAVQLNSTRFVRLLMTDNRVDPNIRDNQGNSPLMAAVMLNHVGCVESILPDARADLTERSNYQRSDEDVAR